MIHRVNRRQFVFRGAAAAGTLVTTLSLPALLRANPPQLRGDLIGRLLYDGKPPARAKLKVDKDLACCGKFDIRDESLIVGPDGGLANVYVYCRGRKLDICPGLEEDVPKQVLLDNRNCIFSPHCLAVWCAKQELSIVNSDPVAQNVAFSPLGDVPANIVLTPPPDAASRATWRFARAQPLPVAIACNYHPWESAFILPLDHPYVDITKPDGTFKIASLPAHQELEFQFWHERVGRLGTPQWKMGRLKITIQPGVNDLGVIKLPASLFEKTV